MGNSNGKNMRIVKDFTNARGKFGVDVGNEEHRGLRTDFLGNRPHGDGIGNFWYERIKIIPQRSGEPSEFGVGKGWLQNPDPIPRIGDGSGTVASSDGACGDEFENRYGLVETRGVLFSKTHGR